MRRVLAAIVITGAVLGASAAPAAAHWIDSPGTAKFGGLFIEVPDHTKGLSCAEKVSPVINRPILDPSVPCFGP